MQKMLHIQIAHPHQSGILPHHITPHSTSVSPHFNAHSLITKNPKSIITIFRHSPESHRLIASPLSVGFKRKKKMISVIRLINHFSL
jgi:hypothetical protein